MNRFWRELAGDLERELDALGKPAAQPAFAEGKGASWLKRHQKKSNAACWNWICTGRWPKMSAQVQYQVGLRLITARTQSIVQATTTWPSPERAEALRWLLIDFWDQLGVREYIEATQQDPA